MAHNPDNSHPVLHASLDETHETREARQRQLEKLNQLQGQLTKLPTNSPQAEKVRREAIRVLNGLYEECKGSMCSCMISNWYYKTSAELGAPLSWMPLLKGDLLGGNEDTPEGRQAFWRLFRG